MVCRGADSVRNVVCFVGIAGCLCGPTGHCQHIAALRHPKLDRNESVTDDTVRLSLVLVFAPARMDLTALLLLTMGINWEIQGWSEKGSAPLHD